MTGFGQFGPIEMGGMFSVRSVRPGLARDDYKDPGWYQHSEGTVAYEWTGEKLAEPGPRDLSQQRRQGGGVPRRRSPQRPVRPADAGSHGNH